jgi:hypothetical protein
LNVTAVDKPDCGAIAQMLKKAIPWDSVAERGPSAVLRWSRPSAYSNRKMHRAAGVLATSNFPGSWRAKL